jgi:hypothetical protein
MTRCAIAWRGGGGGGGAGIGGAGNGGVTGTGGGETRGGGTGGGGTGAGFGGGAGIAGGLGASTGAGAGWMTCNWTTLGGMGGGGRGASMNAPTAKISIASASKKARPKRSGLDVKFGAGFLVSVIVMRSDATVIPQKFSVTLP